MDRRRDKNLIVESNAAMPGRKYSEEKPWSCISLVRGHLEDVFAVEQHLSGIDHVLGGV